MSSPLNEPLLDKALGQLEQARSWSPRAISKFETFIRAGDDYALFRVNPLHYATERSLPESEALDLFLHATKLGVFELDWHSVCGTCGQVITSLRHMHQVRARFRCNICPYEGIATLDDFLQVSFTLAPAIRPLIYHQLASLSAEELCFQYSLSKDLLPPPGFDRHADFVQAVTRLVTYLEPGEKRQVEFETLPGLVTCGDALNNLAVHFIINPSLPAEAKTVTLQWREGQLTSPNYVFHSQRIDMGNNAAFNFEQLGELGPGPLILEFENHTPRRCAMWVRHFHGEPPRPGNLRFVPFLSGKRLITTQTFRELFRTETVGDDEGLEVKDITLLFTDLKGSTALYDTVGDPKAYFLVRQHFEVLGRIVRQYEGATIKTIGDAVMATFMTPLEAARAALDMVHDIEAFNRTISDALTLKIGIHRGRSIVVTLNDRLDYFGQTVNIAARVQALADANEIYVSDAVYQYPGVQAVLADQTVTTDEVTVKGISEKLLVHKIIPTLETSRV